MRRIVSPVKLLNLTALVSALLVIGCGGCNKNGDGKTVRLSGMGATFVNPIMQKWSHEYANTKRTEIDYSGVGSSDGIAKMMKREADFGCSDAPMKKKQVEDAQASGGEVMHVPLILGGVAVIHNVPGIAELKLSGPVIADIYRGKIRNWNEPRIAALNQGSTFPDLKITQVYRSEGSGTSNIFTEFLSKVSPEFQKEIGASTSPKWPEIGTGQAGSDGVAKHVKDNAGSIGYVEVAYAKKNVIAVARVQNSKGAFTLPDADAVTAAGEWGLNQPQTKEPYSLHKLTYSLTNADSENAYPISGISYCVLFKKQSGSKGRALVEFLKWATTEGQKFAIGLDYAPLPAELGTKVSERLNEIELID